MRIGARGAPVRLAAVTGGGSDSGQGLALTRAAVVFSQNGPGDGGAGAIMSVPFAGGEVATLAQSSGQVSAIVVDDANVYFVDDAGTERVSQAGGAVVTLSTVKPFSLAVVGGSLYLAAPSSHEVYAVPVGGGPTTVLAEDADGPERIIPCGEHLCWTAGPLMSANLKQWVSGGAAVLADGLYKPFEVAFTGRSFFLTAGGSELYRIPATGGAGISIADGAGLTAVAVDHDCLYWSSLRGIYSWDLDAAESTPGISAEQ